ncbi:hypothetical protein DQR93_25520 [Salmonella enterica subsp. enterica serovar Bovismorbificans]|nr:hypothetical protein [Salmonella enterica]EBW9776059.1 hypothetical protein [Salmonella enterica subsp. enterica serovar Bovismorbificans]ECA8347599.1 hypothetical protein [Salmonella enterica subsp. enterica serovar Agona]OYG84571.1 hypothetical protein CI729_22555 [Shigella sonnei]PAQ99242.1 hypothetical protein BIU72_26000 [Escherichia coli]
MMSLWDALRMNMMISYQELVRTFLNIISASTESFKIINPCSIHNVVPLLLSVFTANGSRNSVAVLRPPAVAARPSLC